MVIQTTPQHFPNKERPTAMNFAQTLASNGAFSVDVEGVLTVTGFTTTQEEVDDARSVAIVALIGTEEVIQIESEDAKRWCHGMFSNQVKALKHGEGSPHVMADDRGRIQALIDLYCIDEERFIGLLRGESVEQF